MASREQLALAAIRALYGVTVVSFVAIGVQLFLCGYGLALYFETPKEVRKGRRAYIIISWAMLVLFCLAQVADAYQLFNILYHAEKDNPLDVLRLRHADDRSWWRIPATACIFLVNWIADGLLVYRCYIIWRERRWVCILPSLVYLSSMGMSVVTIMSVVNAKSIATRLDVHALSAWTYLSVSVNFLVTCLISFLLYRLRRYLLELQVLSPADLRVYLGVIAILVESAVPLTICGLIFAIVVNPKTVAERVPNGIFLVLWFSLNAICPQLIIFRITTGRSWLQHPEKLTTDRDRDGRMVSTNIVFDTHTVPGVGRVTQQSTRDGRDTHTASQSRVSEVEKGDDEHLGNPIVRESRRGGEA